MMPRHGTNLNRAVGVGWLIADVVKGNVSVILPQPGIMQWLKMLQVDEWQLLQHIILWTTTLLEPFRLVTQSVDSVTQLYSLTFQSLYGIGAYFNATPCCISIRTA